MQFGSDGDLIDGAAVPHQQGPDPTGQPDPGAAALDDLRAQLHVLPA
ncbi:hypothetical protein ACFXG4_13870 [Nocardia sp. NPDC059246]